MAEPADNLPKRRYRWPWIALVAIIVWLLLAVLWMSIAVRRVEEQRKFGAPPVPSSTK